MGWTAYCDRVWLYTQKEASRASLSRKEGKKRKRLERKRVDIRQLPSLLGDVAQPFLVVKNVKWKKTLTYSCRAVSRRCVCVIGVALSQSPGQRGCGAPCRVFRGVRRPDGLSPSGCSLRRTPATEAPLLLLLLLLPSNSLNTGRGTRSSPSRWNLSRSVSSKEIFRSEWRIFSTTSPHPFHPPPHPPPLTTPPSPLDEDSESPAPVRPPQSLSLVVGSPKLRVLLARCGRCRETRTGDTHVISRSEQKSNSFTMEVCVLRGGAHGLIAGPLAW